MGLATKVQLIGHSDLIAPTGEKRAKDKESIYAVFGCSIFVKNLPYSVFKIKCGYQ